MYSKKMKIMKRKCNSKKKRKLSKGRNDLLRSQRSNFLSIVTLKKWLGNLGCTISKCQD